MTTRILLLFGIVLLVVQCTNRTDQQTEEAADEELAWTILFDGSNKDAWRDTKSEQFPEHGWVIEGDVLSVLGEKEGQPGGHDIISKKHYGNFELELEVKLSEGANSGIKYIVSDAFPGKEGSFLGLEYQLIDNERHPDAKKGRDGNRKMAALYDLIPPPEDLTINPAGDWNRVRILLDGDKVEHWLNNEKVLEFDRKSLAFRELVSLSKYKDLDEFGELEDGNILLQGHGNDVSFRDIKIRTW
ncbi:MAG: DUF1080 domain-containing protein [Bacteroides sp.]|nr:DUF1080 domain-containing protein [Bacteroides sp.]